MKRLMILSFIISFTVAGILMAPAKSEAVRYGFVQGCVVPAFAIDGHPICPIAYTINTLGQCCMDAAAAPAGGICNLCSDPNCKGACQLTCKPSCPSAT